MKLSVKVSDNAGNYIKFRISISSFIDANLMIERKLLMWQKQMKPESSGDAVVIRQHDGESNQRRTAFSRNCDDWIIQ